MTKNSLKKMLFIGIVFVLFHSKLPVNSKAESTITSKKNVNYAMDIIKTNTTYNVFQNAPYDTPGAKKLGNANTYIGKPYQAVKEPITDNKRTWVNFKDLNGKFYDSCSKE